VILVIVTFIWQKLSNVEHKMIRIVTHHRQLFSSIFGETRLIVRNIWSNLKLGMNVPSGQYRWQGLF
jgi:hypothetical protein